MPRRLVNRPCTCPGLIQKPNWGDNKDNIAHSTLSFLRISKWPVVRLLCKRTNTMMRLPWKWIRTQPRWWRDWSPYLNDRCGFCGWLTNRREGPVELNRREDLCAICGNNGLCCDCTQIDKHGMRLCGNCIVEFCEEGRKDGLYYDCTFLSKPVMRIVQFLLWYNLHDIIDEWQQNGDFSITRRSRLMLPLIMRAWLRCVHHPSASFMYDGTSYSNTAD